MDPNANLKEQAECIADLAFNRRDAATNGHAAESVKYYRRHLADLRAALTDWLNAGGFAPDWSRYPSAARYYGQPRAFRDLPIGASFEFDRTGLPIAHGLMSGPWRKVAARRYHRLSEPADAVPYRVGSINVRVWPAAAR